MMAERLKADAGEWRDAAVSEEFGTFDISLSPYGFRNDYGIP
jgi:hypothetical protein